MLLRHKTCNSCESAHYIKICEVHAVGRGVMEKGRGKEGIKRKGRIKERSKSGGRCPFEEHLTLCCADSQNHERTSTGTEGLILVAYSGPLAL